jgi:hypothetical protein
LLDLCFADDALVHDEGCNYRGLEAIKSWKRETEATSHYVVDTLDASVRDGIVVLKTRLTGDFP